MGGNPVSFIRILFHSGRKIPSPYEAFQARQTFMNRPLLLAIILPIAAFAADDPSNLVNPGGLNVFRTVAASSPGNVCLSPYSIQSALAMTYAGSAGTTREQMAKVLVFPESADEVAKGFSELNTALTSTAKNVPGVVRIANRLYGEETIAFRNEFLDLLKGRFEAPMERVSFQKDPAGIRTRINSWVEETTEGRIADLIPADAITSNTLLVLVNALYVKVPWLKPFQKDATAAAPFHLTITKSIDVPTMNRSGRMNYAKSDAFQMVGIPLQRNLEFVILLPASATDAAPEFPESFRFEELRKLAYREVELALPKFRLESPTIPLKSVFISLGMPSAFDVPPGTADFAGMLQTPGPARISISDVFHKTFLEIDEEGLEAAAATAVLMARSSAPFVEEDPIPVKVDRPFLFILRHVPSNTCLFVGRVVDPR